jgi:hypothetical protein
MAVSSAPIAILLKGVDIEVLSRFCQTPSSRRL